MSYLTAVLLGLVQGITEFLPVSSSGHLALLQNIFHVEGADLIFDVLLHVGTLLPILFVYGRDARATGRGLLAMAGMGKDRRKRGPKARQRRRMGALLLAGILPLVLGFFLKSPAETLMANTALVSIMLLVTGGILYLAARFPGAKKEFREITILDALLVGLSQVLAVIPGISRSGVTISAGLLRGFPAAFAVKFSFLLSIPAVLGAAILMLVEAVQLGFDTALLPMYLSGMAAAAVSGYFSIRLLRYVTARGGLRGFAYYCWGAGVVGLLLSLVA